MAAPNIKSELQAVAKGLSAGKCDVPRMRRLTQHPDWGQVPSMARSFTWAMIGLCDYDSLHEAAQKATAEPETPAMAWIVRFTDSVRRDDFTDAVTALAAAVERKDETFTLFDDDVYKVARETRDDRALFRRFAGLLDRAAWRPEEPLAGGDWIWAGYAAILADEGDKAQAWRIASRVTEPEELLKMRLDKRFDPVVAIDASRFDVVAAAEGRLKAYRDALAKNPRDGTAATYAVAMLRILGRHAEALTLVDSTLAQSGKITTHDGDDQRVWLANDRALVLFELGRFDEAVAAMEAAAAKDEDGGPNVSQAINLSGLQNSTGRFGAALATLSVFDKEKRSVSPYGLMWIEAERACALFGLGRGAEAAPAMAYTAEHAKENDGARAKALLCADDQAALATAVRERLASADRRDEALMWLSRYKWTATRTAFDLQLGDRLEALRQRPDVRAAIDTAGRIQDVPVHVGPMIDVY